MLTLEGSVVEANACFRELCGIAEGMPADWRLPRALSRAGSIFYETQIIPVLLLRGVLKEVALDLIPRPGEQISVLMSARLNRGADGRAENVSMALFEAKERRQYERELLEARRSSEQIADVVRRSSDSIMTVSPEGTIRTWNNGAIQMFGYTVNEAVGASFVELLFVESASQPLQEAMAALRRGKEARIEGRAVRKGREELDVSISMTPHMEAPGILVAFSAIVRDTTARKLAERALLQNEKLASVGRLASSIAHEINNPLEAVTNLLYILESRVGPEHRELVSTAQEELARVSHIATHTLRFHKQTSSRTPVDLHALFESVLGLYRARLKNAGVEVVCESETRAPLLCFEGELRQVLVNLVSNAFDAMRTGGRLTLRSREVTLWRTGAKGVRITVADTGSGMTAEMQKHLFEPFFSTKGIGGTGLGLWIVKDLVAKNEGEIRVRSSVRPERCGTAVVLCFRGR